MKVILDYQMIGETFEVFLHNRRLKTEVENSIDLSHNIILLFFSETFHSIGVFLNQCNLKQLTSRVILHKTF